MHLPRGAVTIPERSPTALRVPSNVRLRGANIVPNAAGWIHGEPTIWAAMWNVWDWTGTLKPQIDNAVALGCNAITFGGSMKVFLAGFITENTYLTRWQQVLDYCVAQNLYIHPKAMDTNPISNLVNSVNVASHYKNWGNLLAQYPNVIGVDVNQESWHLPSSGFCSYNWLLNTNRLCADVMHSAGLPVTISFPAPSTISWWLWNWDTTSPLFGHPDDLWPLCDYLDIHLYVDVTSTNLANAYTFSWAFDKFGKSKPMIFGEFGVNEDTGGPFHGTNSTTRANFYTEVQGLVTARSDNAGAFAWAAWDQNTDAADQFGLFSAPGVQRSDICTPFATFPTTR